MLVNDAEAIDKLALSVQKSVSRGKVRFLMPGYLPTVIDSHNAGKFIPSEGRSHRYCRIIG